jgi:hypothetical protein
LQGADTGLANQLSALGMMSGQFMAPLGTQMMENYYKPGVSPGSIAAVGINALKSGSEIYQNYKLEKLLDDLKNKYGLGNTEDS